MSEDENWDETEDSWRDVVGFVERIIAESGKDPTAFDIGSEYFEPYVVDLSIVDLSVLSPEEGLQWAESIKAYLAGLDSYWKVRFWILGFDQSGDEELVVWLEIDKYRIVHWLGKVVIERFGDLEEFTKHYWGASNRISCRRK